MFASGGQRRSSSGFALTQLRDGSPLTSPYLPHLPKTGVGALAAERLSFGNAELIISCPLGTYTPSRLASGARTHGIPPSPPQGGAREGDHDSERDLKTRISCAATQLYTRKITQQAFDANWAGRFTEEGATIGLRRFPQHQHTAAINSREVPPRSKRNSAQSLFYKRKDSEHPWPSAHFDWCPLLKTSRRLSFSFLTGAPRRGSESNGGNSFGKTSFSRTRHVVSAASAK